uniref:C3H1-type domain-containing protein n=1 Tax=Poecilia reticulata TaxID=8081 RepID=A0A3P9NQQ9_POERE
SASTSASITFNPSKTPKEQVQGKKNQNKHGLKVCQFFQKGKCHFGGRCRLSHRFAQIHLPLISNKKEVSYSLKKEITSFLTLQHRVRRRKDVNKKPRMRTADEVISRILWDTSVDSSEFVVGYVDRFLGVLERPFCDFNWDTNPCDCDYTTELALPRHRIQYFAYRGHRVWDRHSRTDRVFGSTGQSLDPEQQQDGGCETTEEQTGAVGGREEDCARTKNRHEEEEELNEMNHTFAPTHCAGNTSQEQQDSHGLCVEEQAANRSGVYSYSPKQAEEKCGGRPPKKKPTHFITFRANTPTILSCFQQLQEELTALLPSSAPHWQAASKLHVTLCLLVLRGPAEVAAAAEILRRFAQLDRNPPVAVTFPVKLKHFNGKVLYLSPQPQLRLHQLNCGLQEAYRKEGWLHRSSYNPRYHLTLAKVDDAERIFDGVWDLKVGKGLNFGRQPVNTLHLCTVSGAEVNGFYDIICTVTLR